LLLDEEFLAFSLREDVLIAISFYGTGEAHDRHRRMAGGTPSFDVLYPKLEGMNCGVPVTISGIENRQSKIINPC
jgi:sulfatase maturation enzyme AslB (radical SAM superfamily)